MWNTKFCFFAPQTIPSWLHISGANACYSPSCNLNLLNCLQTHLFHVAQWEKLSASAPNVFLFYFSLSKTLPPLGMHHYYFVETLGRSIFYENFLFFCDFSERPLPLHLAGGVAPFESLSNS